MSDRLLPKLTVIGLGYVGLPLAVALARRFSCKGFDIDAARIRELRAGHDRTGEIDPPELAVSSLRYSSSIEDCTDTDIFIITVPTPVDAGSLPDLAPVRSATSLVGRLLAKGRRQIVVYESTVYPGVTEQICGPILEEASGLVCGVDFFLGYSPERINPGDREHTVDRITKVVAGQTPEVLEKLAEVYGAITSGGVFRAKSIQAAEAAKVIENAQRDINIAFINEAAMIFQKVGLSIYDVLDAAQSKWNFLRFTPGLVGGHCIGVDPYYLSFFARQNGHQPEVILSGRSVNDGMAFFLADRIDEALPRGARVALLGLTFKENVPDLRNSKVADLAGRLAQHGHVMEIFDPFASAAEAKREYGLDVRSDPWETGQRYDAVIGAVPHTVFATSDSEKVASLVYDTGLVADIKGMWRHLTFPRGVRRWQL